MASLHLVELSGGAVAGPETKKKRHTQQSTGCIGERGRKRGKDAQQKGNRREGRRESRKRRRALHGANTKPIFKCLNGTN